MIQVMARDVQTILTARGYPMTVEYGPLRLDRWKPRNGLVLVMRDRGASESVSSAVGARRGPTNLFVRALAVSAIVHARSSLPGARISDHEFECDRYVDAFMCALQAWQTQTKALPVNITGGRYVDDDALGSPERWPGVAYTINFSVPRQVSVVDYSPEDTTLGSPRYGEAPLRGTITGVDNSTEVS